MTPTLSLKRRLNDSNFVNLKATLGQVYNEKAELLCVSLELPWLNNQVGISCIPDGLYFCRRDLTGKHKFFAVEKVENRTNVEIHPANKASQLKGCIAFGEKWGIVNCEAYISNSRLTIDKFLENYPDGFHLDIKNDLI